MAKQSLFLLALFLFSLVSSAFSSPSTTMSLETTTREAIFLTIDNARSTRDFLFLFTTTETVRNFGVPDLIPCVEHLMVAVTEIQTNLQRMFVDVCSTTLPRSVEEDVSKIMEMNPTCSAAMTRMDRNIGIILRSRLDGFAKSTYGVLDLVDQVAAASQPPRSSLSVPTPPPPHRVSATRKM